MPETYAQTMDRSWLVQRLTKPRGGVLGLADNPFSFGGGYKNGGLSDEAMGLLRGIFSFDYMGAAEFEFGAVPKALQALARDGDQLTAGSFEILLSQVAPHWRNKDRPERGAMATVYTLCRTGHAAEVEERIRGWAKDGVTSRLKEGTRLSDALRPTEEWHADKCGWLELDNGFFFFTDREMWEQTCRLFGVETDG